MQERKGRPEGCLADETLAAFVDGGLTADERSQVELHLAACRDCFAVFTESVKTLQAMRESGEFASPCPRSPPSRSGDRRADRRAETSTGAVGGGGRWTGGCGGCRACRVVAAGGAA